MKRICVAFELLVAMAGVMTAADAPRVVGLWGDRSGVFPVSNPPIRWDYDTKYNILWHTPAPSFCYGAPAVLGDRVVYLNDMDSEHPFPLLIGLDLATGKECWRVEVNPLTVAVKDPAKRKELDDLYRATVRWRGELNLLKAAWNAASDKDALAGRMKQLGLKPDGDMNRKRYPEKKDAVEPYPPGAPWTNPWKTLGTVGITLDTWRSGGGGWYFGECFATPVSDGKRVYIQLAWGTWAAYDRDGKQVWMQHLPSKGGGDYCQCGRSPFIWNGRLIADLGDWVRAFDCATGDEVWACSRKAAGIKQHEMMSPMPMKISGPSSPGGSAVTSKDYAYCMGRPPFVVRLEDGKPFTIDGISDPGIIARVHTDQPDIVFLAGGGEHGGWDKHKPKFLSPAAVKLSFEGETLKAKVLWHGLNGKSHGSQVSWNIYHDGKLYFRDVILDALTGKLLTGHPGARNSRGQAVPGSTFTLAVTGSGTTARIYGQGYAEHGSEKRKDDLGAYVNCEVYDLEGGRLAVNKLRGLSGKSAMRIRNGIPNWYSYANNFTIVGDRILSRSCDEVICVGEIKNAYGDAELARVAPKLKGRPALATALAHLDSKERPVRVAAAQAIGKLGKTAAPAAKQLFARMQSADPGRAEAGFLGMCTLGPNAGAAATNLVAMARKSDGIALERAKWALAALGPAAEEALVACINDEAGYRMVMQTAALMGDYDAATRVLARGLLGGKAPRFMKWLTPYERGRELTLRDIIPEALIVRGSHSKAGARLLLDDLPADADKDRNKFLSYVRIIAVSDPEALVPRLPDLRRLLKSVQEGGRFAWALDAIGAMGPLAKEALPDLEAWRRQPNLDKRIIARLDMAIARMRPAQPPAGKGE